VSLTSGERGSLQTIDGSCRALKKGKTNSAEVRHHYGRCPVLFGRDEEALVELQRAVEIEPLSLVYNLNLGRHFFFVRQYGRAIEQLRKTVELEPNFAAAHEWLGYAYEKENMRREAVAEWSRALTLSGQGKESSALERTYATSGFEAAVLELEKPRLRKLDESVKRGEYVPASAYATAYAHMGNKQRALAWLNKAVEEPNRFALEFNVNPLFDNVRDNARFAGLLQRVRVSAVQIRSWADYPNQERNFRE
jgi:tetratricopeptide (TPR) repeat protein